MLLFHPALRPPLRVSVRCAPIVLCVAAVGCESSGERLVRIRTYPGMTSRTTAAEVDRTELVPDAAGEARPRPDGELGAVTAATGIRRGSSWRDVARSSGGNGSTRWDPAAEVEDAPRVSRVGDGDRVGDDVGDDVGDGNGDGNGDGDGDGSASDRVVEPARGGDPADGSNTLDESDLEDLSDL